MAESLRNGSSILRGLLTLRLNFRLKGHASHQNLWTADGGWLYHNFVKESLHTKNFVADFIRLKLIFLPKIAV